MFQTLTFERRPPARGPALSVVLHSAVVALLCLAGANDEVRRAVRAAADRVPVLLAPYVAGNAGGGGGAHSPLPPSRGNLPKFSARPFTPPSAQLTNWNPKLPVEPAVVIAAELTPPQFDTNLLGDPWARPGPPSDGPGGGGGIGTGCCGGVGPGKGTGAGPGDGGPGGFNGHALSGETTPPVVLYKTEPEFSEEGRKAKLQGTVVLMAEVDTNGKLRGIRVTRGLGLGLDEKAVEALRQWRFLPAMRNGKAVVQTALIEVNFRLL